MPPQLSVDIEKRLGGMTLRMRLTVGPEILVLFGPSGAGKTQTLQAIAGLMTPTRGRISLDDTVFFQHEPHAKTINVPARKRRIGYVFQQYALFPHMTALANVAYPLARTRDARIRAMALLDRMRLAHLAERMPQELSGGQQQRVAIARALAAAPRVLLFDESFSALDRPIRARLHEDIRALQAEEQLIVVYVTHNLDDAFAIGHRLAVVRDGAVEQIGVLNEVFSRPANRTVLDILGIPNAFNARVVAAGPAHLLLDWNGLVLEAMPLDLAPGTTVTAYIRPEDIRLLYPDRPVSHVVRQNHLAGTVLERRMERHTQHLRVALRSGQWLDIVYPASSYAALPVTPGMSVQLAVRQESIVVIAPPHDPGADALTPSPDAAASMRNSNHG